MGNCASVQKKTGPALKLKCTIDSQGNCIHIESPVKDSSRVNGDHSMTEQLNPKPQSLSPVPYQASVNDLSKILSLFYHVNFHLSCIPISSLDILTLSLTYPFFFLILICFPIEWFVSMKC
jgi:hypothetical protein